MKGKKIYMPQILKSIADRGREVSYEPQLKLEISVSWLVKLETEHSWNIAL